MRRLTFLTHTTPVLLVAAPSVLLLSIAVRAQQGGPPAQPQRQLVPVAASSILLNPDAHYGATVSLIGAVDQVLSKTAFSVDQDKTTTTGKDVLVVAPTMVGAVQANTYVTVIGEVIKFDPDAIAKRAKDYTLDLPADVIEKYRGKPAVLATGVITAELVDVAKRPPPPLTPAEEAFDKVMKQVNAAMPVLRQSLEPGPDAAKQTEAAKQQTAVLRKAFIDAAAFFKSRGTTDATGWSEDALTQVQSIEQAAAGGKWDEAKASATALQALCGTCHRTHREQLEDGSYRVRGSR